MAAARCIDETVVAVIGCKLHLVTAIGDKEDERGLVASVFAFLDCLLTPETVSRIWADGVIGGSSDSNDRTSTQAKRLIMERVSLSSANSLAGVIRLRPALFTGGLIDRNGTTTFLQKFNPSTTHKELQHTGLMVRKLLFTICTFKL